MITDHNAQYTFAPRAFRDWIHEAAKKGVGKPNDELYIPAIAELLTRQEIDKFADDLFREVRQRRLERGELNLRTLQLSDAQARTINSPADEIYFGGRAGCGKTYLLLRIAEQGHQRSIIYRKTYKSLNDLVSRSREFMYNTGAIFNGASFVWRRPSGWALTFGACRYDKDIDNFRGVEYDFIGFDEIATFQEAHYLQLMGWLRTTDKKQRTRVVCAGNPPLSSEFFWVKKRWGAWLDPKHPNPALSGEIRWYARLDDEDVEVDGPEIFIHKGEKVTPLSRTFIPGELLPSLRGTNYEANLQRLPEPLRSQLLHGDFMMAEDDQELQVIPTSDVRAAQARWEQMSRPSAPLRCVAIDVSRGGKNKTVIAKRYNNYFEELLEFGGDVTKTGQDVAAILMTNLADSEKGAPVIVDLTGVGSSPVDILTENGFEVDGFIGAATSKHLDHAGNLGFVNRRAEAWWKFREALENKNGENIALPPDAELLADLTAPTWKLATNGIQIEKKEDLQKRLGRSPDRGDAVVMNYNYDTRANAAYF